MRIAESRRVVAAAGNCQVATFKPARSSGSSVLKARLILMRTAEGALSSHERLPRADFVDLHSSACTAVWWLLWLGRACLGQLALALHACTRHSSSMLTSWQSGRQCLTDGWPQAISWTSATSLPHLCPRWSKMALST